MRTTKATEEIEKAIIHLKKTKREISNYSFDYNQQSLIQLDKTIKQLEALKISLNADSFGVQGVQSQGQLEAARLSR
jgi:hypothetical protein